MSASWAARSFSRLKRMRSSFLPKGNGKRMGTGATARLGSETKPLAPACPDCITGSWCAALEDRAVGWATPKLPRLLGAGIVEGADDVTRSGQEAVIPKMTLPAGGVGLGCDVG